MSEFRLSEGELQMRNLAGDWVSLQQRFDEEIERASRTDDVEGHSARKMNTDFDQLVKMSKKPEMRCTQRALTMHVRPWRFMPLTSRKPLASYA